MSAPPLPESDSESDGSVAVNVPIALVQYKGAPDKNDVYVIDRGDSKKNIHKKRNIPWRESLDALKALNVPATSSDEWTPVEHSLRTLRSIFPVFKSKSAKAKHIIDDYRLLFAFQRTTESGVISVKGALQHRTTGAVVMLTAHNSPVDVNIPKPAHEPGWTVFGVDMIAPACFWNAFKAC
jgi:hypothetical protein